MFHFYFLSLSFAPCGEGGGEIIEIFNLLSGQEVFVPEQDANSEDDSPCSPFCICSDCFPILDMPGSELDLLMEKNRVSSKSTPSFCSPYLPSSFHNDIWQPPQLS